MHDEFLHRLRKDPPPEFASRLQAQLRRQSRLPRRARTPSLLRTLFTILLLGGTAFALTSIALRGLPEPLASFYHHAVGSIAGAHGVPAARSADSATSRWNAPGGAVPAGPAPRAQAPATAPGPATASTAATAKSPGPPARAVPDTGTPPGALGVQVRVVSSWSAYPYAAGLAERANHALPAHSRISVAESDRETSRLCSGGAQSPDAAFSFARAGTVSSPPCPANASGVPSAVVAIPIGYEAVALARSPLYGELDLTRREVFLALAKWVPDPSRPGVVRENPNATWRQVNRSFGPEPIELLGPALSSPAGRSIISLLLQGGCDTYSWITALKTTHPRQYVRICRTVRTDGVYTEVSGDEATRLLSRPNAVGILTFWTLTHSAQKDLSVSALDGVRPTLQSIASGAYPGSRELYLYFDRERNSVSVMARLIFEQPPPWDPDWALIPRLRQERLAALKQALE